MVVSTILDEYKLCAKILFNKRFLNIGIGSISVKLENDKMIINNKNRHYEEDNFCKIVHILQKDLSWKETSEDTEIHSKIYKELSFAKAVINIFPINLMAYSLIHRTFKPIDYLGKQIIDKVHIIEINDYNKWDEVKSFTITKYLKLKNVVIIRGYGVYIVSRDIREAVKKAFILENSASILLNTPHK